VRDDTPAAFPREIESILADPEIRFHVKQVALQVLGSVEEVTPADVELVKKLHADPKWAAHVEAQVWFRRRAWLRALSSDGVLRAMLASANEKEVFKAIWLLRALADEEPGVIVTELRKYVTAAGNWPKYVAGVVQFARDPAPIELSGMLIYLVENGM